MITAVERVEHELAHVTMALKNGAKRVTITSTPDGYGTQADGASDGVMAAKHPMGVIPVVAYVAAGLFAFHLRHKTVQEAHDDLQARRSDWLLDDPSSIDDLRKLQLICHQSGVQIFTAVAAALLEYGPLIRRTLQTVERPELARMAEQLDAGRTAVISVNTEKTAIVVEYE